MKKTLVFLMTLGLVALLVGAGFAAYFSDTETSTGNTLSAGTLDLKVDGNDDPAVAHMDVENMAPGDTEKQFFTLKNAGSICGKPSYQFSNIVNCDNGCTEPEDDEDDTCGDPGPGEGELGGFLYTLVKWSDDGGSTWHEIAMVPHGHTFINNLTGPYGLDEIPVLCEDDEVEIELRLWWHPRSDDNKGQSDSVEFDVIFNLEQE